MIGNSVYESEKIVTKKTGNIIVAYDQNNGIGIGQDLPWGRDLPADMQHFRDMTVGKAVIMGRQTFESIGHPLPKRENIILTHGTISAALGVRACSSFVDAFATAGDLDCFVIGGATVYQQALQGGYIEQVFATKVHHTFDGATAYFPILNSDEWIEQERQHFNADEKNKYPYDFVTYKRYDL